MKTFRGQKAACAPSINGTDGTINGAVKVPLHGDKDRHTECKEPLPSGSVWSGRPFLVECVSIGRATESAEQRANLNFFFASLKEEKYFLNTVDERFASSIRSLYFLFYLILPRSYLTSF